MTCIICGRPETKTEEWAESIHYLKAIGRLCKAHEEEANKMTVPEIKKVIIKPFLPPAPKKEIRNWQEREPGEDG